MRERDLLNKDVVLAEEKEREKGDAIQTLEGELKKLQKEKRARNHSFLFPCFNAQAAWRRLDFFCTELFLCKRTVGI